MIDKTLNEKELENVNGGISVPVVLASENGDGKEPEDTACTPTF